MNSLHSILGGVVSHGTIYGWRLDAMLLSGIVWIVIASYQQLRHSVPARVAGRSA
jgi:hypothetical protein